MSPRRHEEELLCSSSTADRRHRVDQGSSACGGRPREAPKREKQKFHPLHNLASPSPVTDGEVVMHFGNGDLAAYDFAGPPSQRNLQKTTALHDLVGARQ